MSNGYLAKETQLPLSEQVCIPVPNEILKQYC